MRQFLLLGVFFCSLVLVACTSAKSETKDLQIVPLENAEVERVYGLYQQGDYAAYELSQSDPRRNSAFFCLGERSLATTLKLNMRHVGAMMVKGIPSIARL